jgi:DNA polymerase-3 subunit gamma/tau
MAAQALYLKWRPMTFDEVVGQEHVTYTLRNALVSGRVGHAYLFSGPRGTGKTTMARLLAKAVNCLNEDPAQRPDNTCAHCLAINEGRFLDLIEIDAASHTGVDDVRDLRERIAFAPNEGQYKVYIVDEVHRFSGAAFDALLKTLEEPPAHAIFVLATTEIHKVPQTILSRCQRFDFRRIPLADIVSHLWWLVEAEGLQAEEAALELVARQATGSLRDAISLLDQLITGTETGLTLDLAQAILGTVAGQDVQDLTAALIDGNVAYGLDVINQALDQGADPRQFAHQMVEYLRLVMLAQTGGTGLAETVASPDVLEVAAAHAEQLPRRALLATLKAFNEAASDTQTGWQPQLPLELAFINSVDDLYAPSVEAAPAPRAVQPQRAAPAAPPSPSPEPVQEAQAEPVVEETPQPVEPVISLEEIRGKWNLFIKGLRQVDLAAEALLRSEGVHLHSIEGNTVVLTAPSDILRDKMQSEGTRAVIEQVLGSVYQQPLTIRARTVAAQGRRGGEVDDLLAEDSVAAFAVNELGGTVRRIEDKEEQSE